MRRLRPFALTLALLAVACTRVAPSAPGTRHAYTIPGTLRIAMSSTPNTLNPILSTQQVEAFAQGLIFSPLIAVAPDGRDVPVLAREVPTAANGGISRDGLAITYHLRPGVRWQDGAPFTSADVRFTVAAIANPNTNAASRHGWDDVARVDTPDPLTAIFRLKQRFAPAVHTFFAPSDAPYFLLPAHLLAREKSLDRVPFNSAPAGTGPFRLVRWVRGDRMEFAANDRYFMGAPKLRRIVLRFVPDENTIVNELRAHEIDYFTQASPRTYPQLRGIAGIEVRLVPFNGNDAIMINTTHPPLDDPRVRRAIGLALDKRRLVDEVTFGTALPATEDLPSFMWAFDPAAGTASRDLRAARALLAGRRLSFDLAYRSDSITDRQRSVIIASMLHGAGIDVRLHGYTTSLLYAPAAAGGILAAGKYDLGLQTWYAGVDPDDSTQLLCDQRPPRGYNWSRYCSPAMDAAQHDALFTYERAARKVAYARIERLLARDAPFVYLWWPRQIEAVSSDLRGFRPNGIVETWNAAEWSI